MAITVFAAIDVGSHETAMRIYEICLLYTSPSPRD